MSRRPFHCVNDRDYDQARASVRLEPMRTGSRTKKYYQAFVPMQLHHQSSLLSGKQSLCNLYRFHLRR